MEQEIKTMIIIGMKRPKSKLKTIPINIQIKTVSMNIIKIPMIVNSFNIKNKPKLSIKKEKKNIIILVKTL